MTDIVAVGTVALWVAGAGATELDYDCGYRSPVKWMQELRAAVDRGEIADPATRAIPPTKKSTG